MEKSCQLGIKVHRVFNYIIYDGLLSIGTIREQNNYIFFKIILVSYATMLYEDIAVEKH